MKDIMGKTKKKREGMEERSQYILEKIKADKKVKKRLAKIESIVL